MPRNIKITCNCFSFNEESVRPYRHEIVMEFSLTLIEPSCVRRQRTVKRHSFVVGKSVLRNVLRRINLLHTVGRICLSLYALPEYQLLPVPTGKHLFRFKGKERQRNNVQLLWRPYLVSQDWHRQLLWC